MRLVLIAALTLLTQALFALVVNAASEIPSTVEVNVFTDLTEVNLTRVEYDSLGGRTQAYYYFEGRVWLSLCRSPDKRDLHALPHREQVRQRKTRA